MAYPAINQFSAPGYQNIYLPNYMGDGELQKRLIVGFTMDEETQALNNWVTMFGADEPRFYFQRWASGDFVRLPHATGIDRRWAPGTDRPRSDEAPRFTNEIVELFRYGDQAYIDDATVDLSKIGPLVQIIQKKFATRYMIQRAVESITELRTSGNYPSSGILNYYATWSSLASAAGGTLTQYPTNYFGISGTHYAADGTLNDPLLRKMIGHAVKNILLRSNGRVTITDLMILINPNTADRLANSQEIRVYNAQQVNSMDITQGKSPSMWPTFGLPNPIAGVKVFVDPTVYVTSKQDHQNEDTQTFVIPDGHLSIVARPGSVVGMPGSEGFGSVAVWQHKKWAMKPETFPDVPNKRLNVAFMDWFKAKLVAPEITFTIADIFA